MKVEAQITYYLSERGRKDSLAKGGDGRREQSQIGFLTEPEELNPFEADGNGHVSFDARTAPKTVEDVSKYLTITKAGSIEVEWNVVPAWRELVEFARWAEQVHEQQLLESYLEYEADKAATEAAGHAFLNDPSARAENISEDSVTIGLHQFWFNDPVAVEARKRFFQDQEELKKANRATLANWITQFGTANQRQRLAAGLLPWKEAYEALEERLYAPLSDFPRYERFKVSEVCDHVKSGEKACKVKFKSVDATELTAQEWEQYSKIREAVPTATFQLREHTAECTAGFPELKRGVIVKFAVDRLTFKREFTL